MNNQPWFERLRGELARHQLPARYAERLLEELSDHFHDLTEEKLSMEATIASLGEPEQVAEAARATYRRPGFFKRHRWLRAATFVMMPLPVLIVGWAVTFVAASLAVGGLAYAMGEERVQEQERALARGLSPVQAFTISTLMSATVIVPAMALAGVYSLLARRTHTRRRWAVVAGALLACCAGSATTKATFSEEPGKNQIMFGLGIGNNYTRWQIAQFALPLAAMYVFSRRRPSAGNLPAPA